MDGKGAILMQVATLKLPVNFPRSFNGKVTHKVSRLNQRRQH